MTSLSNAVVVGRLQGLEALRDVLAAEIEAGSGERSQTAALARQLRDVLADIELLKKAAPRGSLVDDLSARRKARSPGSEGVVPAAGDGSE